jgi:hypothetical protein
MIIVSFATKNTPYEGVIKEFLLSSLEQLKLSYDIAYPEDRGSWQLNTQWKPTIIKEMLLKHKEAITYIDSDATIMLYPELLYKLQKYDIGVHYFDWYYFWKNIEGNPKREILGGTLYFNYNDKTLAFVDEWIKVTKEKSYNDQQSLNELVPKCNQLKIYSLPIEYCAICKSTKVPDWLINPVIVHHQCSRKYKGWRKK